MLSSPLQRQRVYRRLSVRELADAVGVTVRTVQRWEAGTQEISDQAFGRLLTVLRCDAQDVTGRPRGTERLADLRRAAGLTTADVVGLLARRQTTAAALTQRDIQDFESGRRMPERTLGSPEERGHLVRALSRIYRVPLRAITDAWLRTRPDDPNPLTARRSASRPADHAAAAWEALNDRQRTYLECIFELDQAAEAQHRRARTSNIPAAQWRLQLLSVEAPESIVGVSRLQELLFDAGVRDPGTGSTVDALDRRGLVRVHRDRVFVEGVGDVPRTRVEMTKAGRAAVRAAQGQRPAVTSGPVLLSEWLWSIVVRVAQAGPEGVDGSLAGRGPHFLAVGQSPDGRVPSRGFIELRHPTGVSHGPYRWFLTDSGRRHIVDNLASYRDAYPGVASDGLENLL